MSPPAMLKIACLHGYCQNAQLFRLKSAGLRKALERNISTVRNDPPSNTPSAQVPMAQFFYIDAPFVLEPRPNAQPLSPGQRLSESDTFTATFRPPALSTSPDPPCDRAKRTWWVAKNDGKLCIGWEQSLQYLKDIFREQKFDGILGFSQGAIIASLICALCQQTVASCPEFSSLRFAIMISGFPARATDLQHMYDLPIAMPSMHVWGVEDKMIPAYASRRLLEKFDERDRNCVVHPKGHLVPCDATSRRAISQFVLKYSEQLNAALEEQLRAAL